MSRNAIFIEWTPEQREQLQPLFDEITTAAKKVVDSYKHGDGLLGQVFTYGMTVRYIENKEVLAIQKINHKAQKEGRQIK